MEYLIQMDVAGVEPMMACPSYDVNLLRHEVKTLQRFWRLPLQPEYNQMLFHLLLAPHLKRFGIQAFQQQTDRTAILSIVSKNILESMPCHHKRNVSNEAHS